jgi:fructoselysine-6-P-deglycase FrlB-like protein
MTLTEQDIKSTPAILRQTLDRIDEQGAALAPLLQGPVAFLGSGSSYCVALAAASLYEATHGAPGQGILASQYLPRGGWSHLGISRTGQTTELVEAMRQAREAGGRVGLLGGEPGAPAMAHSDAVLSLEFASEEGVIQTRFITAAILALRLLVGGEAAHTALGGVPEQVEQGLATFDPTPLVGFDHVVFLGRDWRHGVALTGALNLQETAIMVPEGHQTLDYRHGPIASADERTLVWCFDPQDDALSNAVLDDVRKTGATVQTAAGDPLVAMVQAQLLAVRMAEARGVNPDEPRNLQRAIILPAAGA